MKLLLPALAALIFAGCTQTIYNHRTDFSPTKPKGPWTDYYKSVAKTDQPAATTTK